MPDFSLRLCIELLAVALVAMSLAIYVLRLKRQTDLVDDDESHLRYCIGCKAKTAARVCLYCGKCTDCIALDIFNSVGPSKLKQ